MGERGTPGGGPLCRGPRVLRVLREPGMQGCLGVTNRRIVSGALRGDRATLRWPEKEDGV